MMRFRPESERSIASFFKFCAALIGSLALSGCVSFGMDTAARKIQIDAQEDGPTDIYWTYWSSVSGKSPSERNQHLKNFEGLWPLPLTVQGQAGETFWIAPHCGGTTLWTSARAYQADPKDRVLVSC